MSKGKEAGKIQVYVRVRPFTEREKEKREPNAIEIHQEHSLIRVLDPRSRTNYFFDGVFSPEATNHELYLKVGKPLVYAALNGYKGTLLTYGQTGTGKTFTLLSDDGITTRVVRHCFEKIDNDEIHTYKVMCSFLQVYQEKVYDLLNPRLMVDLPVREHPKKGVYVANLTQHEVKSAGDVFALLEVGKQHLVIAETKMVRHSSRSHSIMQLIIERRLKEHIANEKPPSESDTSASQETVQESIMAVDETINNLIKELKQERKSHHKRERECLKELMEKEVEKDSLLNNGNNFEGDLILKGKINLCDLAGSERLTKTKAEGVRLTEAKYLNTSLLELGNVIYALARGHKRHVPYRNSTLTRLLQDCLGDNGKTNFIICIAPSLAEVNETKCSLNFGLRAMRITNVARLNVEVDYKVLAERLAKKLEDHDIKYKFEKLEYLREIQRLKSAITCYQESENFAGKDHEKLVSVIANLSKSVQREKEEKNNLQTKLVCLKKQVSQPMGSSPDVEAILLAELMSLDLLANLQTPDVAKSILSDTSLPAKVKSHLALFETQEALLSNAGCFLQLLDLHLVCNQDFMRRKDGAPGTKDHLQFTLPRPGVAEMSPKDSSRSVFQEPNLSLSMCNPESDETSTGLAGGVRKMLVKLIGRDSRERTSPDAQPSARSFSNGQGSLSGNDVRVTMPGRREIMVKTKALLKQLSNSKGNVEQQVLNLMSSLVEEQVNGSEESLAETLQWNELRKKLTRLIMFRRNNMPSLTDVELWANSENLNSVLENCLRFVIIDKTLLACLLVIELIDLRQACEIIEGRRHFPTDPNQSIAQEDTLNPNKSYNEKSGVKGDIEISTGTGNRKGAFAGQENGKNPKESISPRREKLRNLKHSKTELEKEISEVHEDTSKLETELFSTMEEKTKVEEELFGMKHHVTKLRSELFHLKLEKSNLENDVKRSQSQENLQQSIDGDDGKVVVESPKEVVRTYPELSDVMEVSHESNDSENSSQMSDGHESREAFLKTCMENISKIYPFMPHPGVEAASDDELTDDQEPTFSDANIDDSDEEIIITKLARSLRSPCTSPAKEKSSEATSPSKSGKKLNATALGPRQKAIMANDNNEDLKSKSKEALVKQIQELKRKLHKTEQELAEAQESSEDLEEELDHKKGQLAEAQETITNLENQLVEEKENCEQVREEYFNVKTQRDILDEKIKALRSELERVLVRENNALSAALKTSQGYRSDNPPPSPTKITAKTSMKSPGKTKVGKIDLRNPPQTQFTSNEMEVVGLLEETAELKVKLDKATQEKARLEKSQKFQEEKSARMTAALRTSEDACSRLKNEFAILKKEKMKLEGEVVDIRNNNLKIVDELQKYKDKSSRLEKDIEAISYMSTRLEKDNKMLEMEISKMESDLSSCKSKHEVASKECKRLNQERVQVEKECEKALHELETLKIQNTQLLESEVSEQKRLNCNLQKELAGMAEYQEALENEYSKVKSMEQSLRQELAKVSSRVVEVETELATVSQNSHPEGAIAIFREDSLSFGQESHNNTQKPELIKGKKTFNKTPSKKFYTITHTSEDEIGDTSSSIAESPADESKQLEHEYQLLKLENGYLQQQLSESEHVLTMYRQDLESAHDLIDKLQANESKVLPIDQKNELPEEDCKTPSDKDDTIKEIKEYPDNANDEYKLLEEKHAELTREYEILRQQYQEALTDKEKEADGMARETTNLIQSVPATDQTEKVVLSAKKDVSGLTERITELEADNGHLKIQAEELSRNEMAKIVLMRSLDDAKQEITQLKSEIEALRAQSDVKILQQSTSGGLPNPLQLEPMKDVYRRITSDDDEVIKRKLEEDLLKVTSEKLKLEFELASANKDCERLKNDLDHSESERNLLNSQLNDNIEKAANLEVRLVEMRCSCETIKEEINMLKNQKRQESFHLHEASVCKEILEKRLEDSLKENNFLRQELDTLHEERRESEKNSTKLEKEKDQLTIEIENVKTQIRKLELEFEESKAESETRQNEKNQDEKMTHGDSGMENFVGYSKRNKDDQEQSPCHREEVYITTDHSQMKNPLEEVKHVKESHENITITTTDNCGQCKAKKDEATVNYQTENKCQGERTTFDTLEIEKHTILLEKEKRLLEKELTRVQEECSKLKQKLEVIKYASENTQTQEERRKDLEERHEQLQKELQELRALNQRLETECDDSHKLIQELEVKTKALESLQKELHCFHKENERLTHEVEIIQNTSKAMTDHQRSRESLESENATLKEKLERLKDCNRKLQADIEELGRELPTFKEQSRNISQDSSEKSNVSLQNQVEKLQKMQKHLESELASSREKIKELELANESLRKENKAVKGRIKSLEQRNEELRRKDDKKKTNNAENKPKAKIKGEPIALKDSKEATSVTSKTAEETAKNLQTKIELLENEKIQLEEKLNSLKEKSNGAVKPAPRATMATQTTELQSEDEIVETLNTVKPSILKDHNKANAKPENKSASTPLTIDMQTGYSLMAKEKLVLERKATHFARTQMQLEQAFAKAMKENAMLKAKVGEKENVLEILREKVHELEKKNSAHLSSVDLKQNVLISSDSESEFEQDKATDPSTKDRGKSENADSETSLHEALKSAKSNSECPSKPLQPDVEESRREKEKLVEMAKLKLQQESWENVPKQQEDLQLLVMEVEKLTTANNHSCLIKPSRIEVEQPQRESAPVDKETTTGLDRDVPQFILPSNHGCEPKSVQPDVADQIVTQKETKELVQENQCFKTDKDDVEDALAQKGHEALSEESTEEQQATFKDVCQLKTTQFVFGREQLVEHDDRKCLENLAQENELLKQERESLLEELEEANKQKNWTENELKHNKESCLKQEQEMKLLLSSYSQEKESLLKEVENTSTDCRKAKEKLRELQQIESDFDDIRRKSKEAEHLITELEKDLLSQTEMKNELKRELQTCQNQLQKMTDLEKQLHSCRAEIKDLQYRNEHLTEEVKRWKDANEAQYSSLQLVKAEKPKRNSASTTPSTQSFQSRCVQTITSFYKWENNVLEDKTVANDSHGDNASHAENAKGIDNDKENSYQNKTEDVSNNTNAVESNSYGVQSISRSDIPEGNFDHPEKTAEMTLANCTGPKMLEEAIYYRGLPIPIIIVSQFDDIGIGRSEHTATFSLRIEDFECDSPNDQSTPDEENEKFEHSVDKERCREMKPEGPVGFINTLQDMNEKTFEINLPSETEFTIMENAYPGASYTTVVLEPGETSSLEAPSNLLLTDQQISDDAPSDALSSKPMEIEEISSNDMEIPDTNTDTDISKTRRELEWNISSLKSELAQRAEEHEKNQLEIGALMDEKLCMKREISSLVSECESLRAKTAVLQTQNEAIVKEQILNDEELEELQQNLRDLKQEKNEIEEAKKNLESQNARLEIELSDAMETKEAMERELFRVSSEDTDASKLRLETQLHDITERYTKLETVLSCVLDENSQMTAQLSALQAENSMLKSFKIMEITDNCTQFSPRTTEDESDGEGRQSEKRKEAETSTKPFTSKANLTLSLDEKLIQLPSTNSPPSPNGQGRAVSNVTPCQAEGKAGENTYQLPRSSNVSRQKKTELSIDHVGNSLDEEKSIKRDRGPLTAENSHQSLRSSHDARNGRTPPLLTDYERALTEKSLKHATPMINRLPQRKRLKNNSRKYASFDPMYDASEDVLTRDSDDNDSSMEVNNTSSSLVSATDLDMSISSDQISSEDSTNIGPEIRVLQKMQKELAETKCSNVLVKNELSIIKRHNSDLQSQVQKLLSRNNHLKTKMCERTLSVKRMEKEVSSIKDDNNRLQQEALAMQEEISRLEKEKAKFERNMSSTKSENKRLKSDLSSIKAESYRTMKELVNLQSENRRLQLEIGKLREEIRSFKGVLSDESVSQELPLWGSLSNGDLRSVSRRGLQERPARQDSIYLQQRASTDIAFCQHKQHTERTQMPELLPLNLTAELNDQHSDGGSIGKALTSSADTISGNSSVGTRAPDPLSRLASPLSFTSEGSLPSEQNDRDENEHNREKVAQQDQDEDEGKGKNKKKIKTILRKLQNSKKTKSSK